MMWKSVLVLRHQMGWRWGGGGGGGGGEEERKEEET